MCTEQGATTQPREGAAQSGSRDHLRILLKNCVTCMEHTGNQGVFAGGTTGLSQGPRWDLSCSSSHPVECTCSPSQLHKTSLVLSSGTPGHPQHQSLLPTLPGGS